MCLNFGVSLLEHEKFGRKFWINKSDNKFGHSFFEDRKFVLQNFTPISFVVVLLKIVNHKYVMVDHVILLFGIHNLIRNLHNLIRNLQ